MSQNGLANSNGATGLGLVMQQIPSGLFVVTAAHDGVRSGVLAAWVQQCAIDPPMIMFSLPKGRPVEPLIRDSRSFALCQVGSDDRILHRKFATVPDRADDPFVAISTRSATSGAPVVDHAMAYLDCELIRLIDIESDHLVYVGHVKGGSILHETPPAVVYGENGSVFRKADSFQPSLGPNDEEE